jgi:hypothetical protein
MRKLIILLAACSLFGACQPVVKKEQKEEQGNDRLQKLSWMIGTWEMKTPDGSVVEQWTKPTDTSWRGVSYMLSGGDTTFLESITLNYEEDHLQYIPAVTNQNGGQGVSFAEKSFSDSLVVFENLNHDFPQRIIYKRISDTSILAAIEGVQNGQNRREEFAYLRK